MKSPLRRVSATGRRRIEHLVALRERAERRTQWRPVPRAFASERVKGRKSVRDFEV